MNKKLLTAVIIFVIMSLIIIGVGVFGNNLFNYNVTYTKDDLSFKSNELLFERPEEGFVVSYSNLLQDVAVLANKESKEYLESLDYKDLTLEDYSKIVYDNGERIGELKKQDDKDYYYFTYNYKDDYDDIFYLTAMYINKDDFWIVNFACDNNKKEQYEDKFLEWADSVTFRK